MARKAVPGDAKSSAGPGLQTIRHYRRSGDEL